MPNYFLLLISSIFSPLFPTQSPLKRWHGLAYRLASRELHKPEGSGKSVVPIYPRQISVKVSARMRDFAKAWRASEHSKVQGRDGSCDRVLEKPVKPETVRWSQLLEKVQTQHVCRVHVQSMPSREPSQYNEVKGRL